MGPTPAKVGTIMTGIHRQPVLIPGLVCWKWRWNVQPEKSACHKMLDLGSVNAPPPLEHRDSGVGWSSPKLQAKSFRPQAMLDTGLGYDRMYLERINYEKIKTGTSKRWQQETGDPGQSSRISEGPKVWSSGR
jgi:hypothetical protein